MGFLYLNKLSDLSLKNFKNKILLYTILFYTWGSEKVSYKNLINKGSSNKANFKKILFCKKQAACDKLYYF